jgi:hypothetical protein
LGFQLRFQHAGAQVAEVAGVRRIDYYATTAELSAV